MKGLAGKMFRAVTGADPGSVEPGADLRGMLMAVGGAAPRTRDGKKSRTRSGIDLTRAAEQLGVSRRTVERWLKAEETGVGQRPTPVHAKKLATKARQAASTQRGRRASLAHSGLRQDVAHGTTLLTITGRQGLGPDYIRQRNSILQMKPQKAAELLDVWERGGEKALMSWLNTTYVTDYLHDWQFESIDRIAFQVKHGNKPRDLR